MDKVMDDWVFDVEERRKSFKYWPYKMGTCTAQEMAEAGFYSIGTKKDPDWAVCFVCLKELDGWEYDDDPWSEHRKHQPECAYVKLNKNASDHTIADILHLAVQRCIVHKKKVYSKLYSTLDELQEEVDIIVDKQKKGKENSRKGRGRAKK